MIIFRYLSREVMHTMLAIIIILMLIFMTNFFSSYMADLTDGEITLLALSKMISMQVPLLLGYLLPLALFLSVLIVYVRFAMQHELVVLQACGFSRSKLYGYTLLLSAGVIVLVAVLMLAVEPVMQKYRLQMKAEAFAEATIAKVIPQRFINLGGVQGYLYAQSVDTDTSQLQQVFWARQLPASTPGQASGWDWVTAAWADEQAVPGELDHFLVFHKGREYRGVPGQADFKVSDFKQYGVRLAAKAATLDNPIKFASTHYLWKHRHSSVDANAELQWRMAMPISALLLVMMAVSLSQANPRHGKLWKIFPAILLYVLYANLMFVARDKIESHSWLGQHYGMWWVHALFFVLVVVMVLYDLQCWRYLQFRYHAYKTGGI